jgi:4-amino-4-deoxy-L-arabinose transferase-like glycosyltransferase
LCAVKRTPSRLGLLAIALAAVVYGFTATGRAVLDVDDALYVEAGQQMLVRADFVTPYVNGVRFLDKPPLLYWVLAALYRLLGATQLAAHLPSALAVVATTGLLVRMTARAAGPTAGLLAGLAFPFCVGTCLFTRETLHDPWLVLFLTWGMDSFLRWLEEPQHGRGPVLALAAAGAGAVLSKGLLGLLFPVGILAAFWWTARPLPTPPARQVGPALGLFLLLALPWHVLAALRNPGFLRHYFINEQVLRFFSRREPMDFVSVPLPLFAALVLVWLFPWSAFLPAVAGLLRRSAELPDPARRLVRLMGCWIGCVGVFLALSARLEHYAFPLLPPFAVLVGVALSRAQASRQVTVPYGILAGIGAVVGLAGLAGAAYLGWRGLPLTHADAARATRAYDTDFGPLGDLPPSLVSRLLPPAGATVAALAIGLVCARVLESRGRRVWAAVSLAGVMLVFALATHASLGICEPAISSSAFGRVLALRAGPGDHVVVQGDYESANSVAFYAPVSIEVVDGAAPTLAAGLAYADAPRLVLSRGGLAALWRGPTRTFVIGATDALEALRLTPAFTIAESGGRVLISNRPSP